MLLPAGRYTIAQSQPAAAQSATSASGNQDAGPPPNQNPNTASGQALTWAYLSSSEFILAVLVILFGVFVLISASISLRNCAITPEQALRIYGVIVILVGTLLLILAGLSNDQIAPATGLFGTLAGYLLGRHQSDSSGQKAAKGNRAEEAQENASAP
jgi:uncharacterized protein YjeT (DUF2065 family)